MARKKGLRAAVLFGAAALLLVGVPANAAVTDDPAYQDVARVEMSRFPVDLPATRQACTQHSRGYRFDAYNNIGVHLWAFGASVTDCTRDGKLVNLNWGACWGWTNNFPVLWNFKGCSIQDQSGQSLPRGYAWRQWRGNFGYCVTWICKSMNPWIYIGARGDGTFGTNGGEA